MESRETPRSVTPAELFVGFAAAALRGFGGVLPWARRLVVDERRWLTAGEFTDLLCLCQLLPGPNVVNLSVALGRRFAGARGAVAAASGLLVPPLSVVLALAGLYGRVASAPAVAASFRGLAAAAAGLTIATGWRMTRAPGALAAWGFSALTFVAVALLHLPLLLVVLVLAPLSTVARACPRGRS